MHRSCAAALALVATLVAREAAASPLLEGDLTPSTEAPDRSVCVAPPAWSGAFRSPSPAPAPSAYALDDVSRDIPAGTATCPRFETRKYTGTGVRYASPIFVHAAFVEKLVAFDALVRAVALEVYGRPPSTLHHLGGTTCDPLSGQRRWSEHALGNAIDVDVFTFDALPKGDSLPEGLPKVLAQRFQVGVSWHFFSKTEAGRVHARFLNRLALRLMRDPSLFRVVLGPGYGDHWSHFHLDAAPYRFVYALASEEAAR